MEALDLTPILVFALMNKKIIDWIRVLLPDHIETKVMIPISWILGMALALTFSASPTLAAGITIWGEQTLANADIILVLVYGFAFASVGGFLHDLAKPTTPPHDAEELSNAEVKPLPPGA